MDFTRNLRKGVSGDDVVLAKERLLSLGYYAERITSVSRRTFGADTLDAVKRFQKQAGLSVDGVIGAETWVKLFGGETAAEKQQLPTPSDKARSIVRLARERIGDLYVWGGSGMTDISDAKIREKDGDTGASRSIAFRDKQYKYGFSDILGHDCSGFISYLLRECGIWNERRDCDALWARCGEVARNELIPGDLLFRVDSANASNETHVGLYCGRGVVIHCKGRDVGVVAEGINHGGSGYWHKCGRMKILYT